MNAEKLASIIKAKTYPFSAYDIRKVTDDIVCIIVPGGPSTVAIDDGDPRCRAFYISVKETDEQSATMALKHNDIFDTLPFVRWVAPVPKSLIDALTVIVSEEVYGEKGSKNRRSSVGNHSYVSLITAENEKNYAISVIGTGIATEVRDPEDFAQLVETQFAAHLDKAYLTDREEFHYLIMSLSTGIHVEYVDGENKTEKVKSIDQKKYFSEPCWRKISEKELDRSSYLEASSIVKNIFKSSLIHEDIGRRKILLKFRNLYVAVSFVDIAHRLKS